MYPTSFTRDGTKIRFWYDEEDYQLWDKIGRESGNSGPILKEINGNMTTHWSYGTNDNPFKERITLSMVNLPELDGKIREPEWYLKPAAQERERKFWESMNPRIVIFDFSKDGDNK